jgi:uncharacterized small protein (DUF1192 family)
MTIEQNLIVMLGEKDMRIAQLMAELAQVRAKLKEQPEAKPEGQS